MKTALHSARRGFTLLEIMIVVAIIALVAAVAIPNLFRARKRAQATRILDDLRSLDQAMDQYAIERSKLPGETVEFDDLAPYLKQMNKLNLARADLFGQPYGPYTVDTAPHVAEITFLALQDVAPAEFWSPYR